MAEREAACSLLRQGASISVVAGELGIGRTTVRRLAAYLREVDELRAAPRPPRPEPALLEAIIDRAAALLVERILGGRR